MAVDADAAGELMSSTETAVADPPETEPAVGDSSETDTADADTAESQDAFENETSSPTGDPGAGLKVPLMFGVVIVVALAVLVGWLGVQAHRSQQEQQARAELLQAARQGAVNLTTIDWQRADADVKRILDGATGQFYDDFAKRSKPFVDVVKQTKSVSVGTITEAGLESVTADGAQVLVAVAVKTSNAGTPDQQPRAWRMRVYVQKVGAGAKVSNVEFVP
ncbi:MULTISPECIES: hypothetical protein [unclassified Mycobacterium]|uniref:hypothetical protein n=1 Tax=unclassified Mycobacterium TaxID=2642494 RepID=UPI00048E6EEB|nr:MULTISPECIES: hypothetical protein [unclassified Mycobacterium]SEA61192.1 Mce-associated membrane protein [Mycobacterium sp. 283mftsu]